MTLSPALLRSLTKSEQAELRALLTEAETRWTLAARPAQLPPPGDWRTWLILAGRGWGKTRTGAEWVRAGVRSFAYVNLIAATADDARDIMIEGESGILAICPPAERPTYYPSRRRLDWPNGARSLIFTADEPERLRGKQHTRLWADEIAAWRFGLEAWDQAMFGLRLGPDPRVVATTTPKPGGLVARLLSDPTTVVTGGTTMENRRNLAPAFYEQIIRRYEGTRLGRQELDAEVLTDIEGALWTYRMIDAARVRTAPDLARVVVAIDPAGTHDGAADETGIVVAGRGRDDAWYVLADGSGRYSPDGWASKAVALYRTHRADRIIGEANNGGEMVEHTLRTVDRQIPYTAVHASRGKHTRAEPIAALYEQQRVHHVGGFADLESQMCAWTPTDAYSPDRMDALVWALTALSTGGPVTTMRSLY